MPSDHQLFQCRITNITRISYEFMFGVGQNGKKYGKITIFYKKWLKNHPKFHV